MPLAFLKPWVTSPPEASIPWPACPKSSLLGRDDLQPKWERVCCVPRKRMLKGRIFNILSHCFTALEAKMIHDQTPCKHISRLADACPYACPSRLWTQDPGSYTQQETCFLVEEMGSQQPSSQVRTGQLECMSPMALSTLSVLPQTVYQPTCLC